ncbi:hypothetical protein C8F04DRAFT_1228262 [Mycena alexandri]|uniref:Uncharacterized protein n=1 Tax=Mycena alexandri TaxID=1745969 RepID=A0AAD6XER0_9AGAR|nr:hypothetical protein C8F04DRAFT_1228262 [Mycena alexandri]
MYNNLKRKANSQHRVLDTEDQKIERYNDKLLKSLDTLDKAEKAVATKETQLSEETRPEKRQKMEGELEKKRRAEERARRAFEKQHAERSTLKRVSTNSFWLTTGAARTEQARNASCQRKRVVSCVMRRAKNGSEKQTVGVWPRSFGTPQVAKRLGNAACEAVRICQRKLSQLLPKIATQYTAEVSYRSSLNWTLLATGLRIQPSSSTGKPQFIPNKLSVPCTCQTPAQFLQLIPKSPNLIPDEYKYLKMKYRGTSYGFPTSTDRNEMGRALLRRVQWGGPAQLRPHAQLAARTNRLHA